MHLFTTNRRLAKLCAALVAFGATAAFSAGLTVGAFAEPEPSPVAASVLAVAASGENDTSVQGQQAGATATSVSSLSDTGRIVSTERVATTPATTVWVSPAERGVCVTILPADALGPGGTCYDDELIVDGNAWQVTGDQQRGFTLMGLAPDGVATATVEFEDGREASVPVIRNLVFLETKKPFVSYSYESNGSRTTVPARGFEG